MEIELTALGFIFNNIQGPLSWVVIILGIGFLIFIHELGHFIVAKYEKVKVEAFALGFGRHIFCRKWGDTEYRINILPLGGYVKMKGELPGDEGTKDPDSFTAKKPGQRARVFVAGVLMNAIFGVLGAILAFQLGVRFIEPTIGFVQAGGPAWRAGFHVGDRILEANGHKINRFNDLVNVVAFSDESKPIQVKLQRGEKIITCKVDPEYDKARGLPSIMVSPRYVVQIRDKEGIWRIIEVNGKKIRDSYDFLSLLGRSNEKSLDLKVEQDGKIRNMQIHASHTRKKKGIGIVTRQLKIGKIRETSLAMASGLAKDDLILAVNDKMVSDKNMLIEFLKTPNPVLSVERNGKKKLITLTGVSQSPEQFLMDICFLPDVFIGEVIHGSSAEKLLQPGDRILEIDGKTMNSWTDIYQSVAKLASQEHVPVLEIKFRRQGEDLSVNITPEYEEQIFEGGVEILPQMTDPQHHGIVQSCKYGMADAKKMVLDIFSMFKALFTRRISPKNLGGPITIFKISQVYLNRFGFVEYIYLLALISINLAVINLLPIPVLDGGHLLFVAIEKLIGKPVPEKLFIFANHAGVLLLLMLILYVTFNDVVRWFGDYLGQFFQWFKEIF